jgi:hypothetical protein
MSDLSKAEMLFKQREEKDEAIKVQETARIEAMRAKTARLKALREEYERRQVEMATAAKQK